MKNKYRDYGWSIRPNQSFMTRVMGVLLNGFLLSIPVLNIMVAQKLSNAYFLKLWKGDRDYIAELEVNELKFLQLWTTLAFTAGVFFMYFVYSADDTPDISSIAFTPVMWVIGGLISFVNSNKIRSRLDIGKTFKNEIIAQKKEVLNISRFEGTGLSFVAIDFETANNNRDSACQMGIVVIENGIITEEKSWLIKPQPNTFLARFTDIHGIDKYDVENSPRFKDIWAVIEPYISGRLLIAHNMRFDESVLNACLLKYGLTVPKYKTLDTLALSRICFNTANYKLPTLCDELGIELNHHDALSDARAAAILFMCCCEKLETFDLEALDNVIYSNNLTHSVDAVAYISFAKKKAVSYNEVVQIMEKQTDYNFIDEVHSASFHLSKDALKLKRLLTATTSWKKEIIMEGINLKHSQLTKIIWLLQSPNPNREDFILADESIEFKNLLSTLKKRNSLIIK